MKKILFAITILVALVCAVPASGQSTGAINGFCELGGKQSSVSGLASSNYLQGIIPACTVTVYQHGLYALSTANYVSGGSVTGTVGQTCSATFLGGTVNGTGTIALTGTNTIANGTAFTISTTGTYGASPTTATLSNGTATCSGTATITSSVVPALATIYADQLLTPLSNPFTATGLGPINAGYWIFWAATANGYDIQFSGGYAPNTFPTPRTLVDVFPSQAFTVSAGVGTINGVQGNFVFSGPDVNCTSTSCTFSTSQVNGGTIPISATIIGTNSSQQFISVTPTTINNYLSGTRPWQATFTFLGVPANSQIVLLMPTTVAVTIPSGCSGSFVGATTAATGSTAFSINKLAGGPTGASTTLCTATFLASGTTASMSGTGGSLAVGDYLEIVGPASADATLANLGGGIYGTH